MADWVPVTPPRQILPGQTVMVTVQAVSRSFRFLPSKRVAQLILYCFIATLGGYKIDVHEFCFLSNHFHIVMTPQEDDLPAFVKKFHSLLSRALNALRGWKGANVEDHYNIVVETDEQAIVRHCAYTLANPCAADLVAYIKHWKGPNSYALEYGEEIVVDRPKFSLWTPVNKTKRRRKRPMQSIRASYRGRWKSPEQATFKLVRPPVLGELSDTQLREHIRELAHKRERDADTKRVAKGRRAMGMKRVLQQKWTDIPNSKHELFGPEPLVASSSRWARREAERLNREFVREYRAARDAWLAGDRDVEFPAGTYLMRVRFNVSCAPAPPG